MNERNKLLRVYFCFDTREGFHIYGSKGGVMVRRKGNRFLALQGATFSTLVNEKPRYDLARFKKKSYFIH
jgi:hypothetical protein